MTADELDALAEEAAAEIEAAEFQYAVAAVLRASHMRQVKALLDTRMADRTVAMLAKVAHHKREARQQEHVMQDAIRRAQALEAQFFLAAEEEPDDD